VTFIHTESAKYRITETCCTGPELRSAVYMLLERKEDSCAKFDLDSERTGRSRFSSRSRHLLAVAGGKTAHKETYHPFVLRLRAQMSECWPMETHEVHDGIPGPE